MQEYQVIKNYQEVTLASYNVFSCCVHYVWTNMKQGSMKGTRQKKKQQVMKLSLRTGARSCRPKALGIFIFKFFVMCWFLILNYSFLNRLWFKSPWTFRCSSLSSYVSAIHLVCTVLCFVTWPLYYPLVSLNMFFYIIMSQEILWWDLNTFLTWGPFSKWVNDEELPCEGKKK